MKRICTCQQVCYLLAISLVLGMLGFPGVAAVAIGGSLRPPAVPLVTHDPYFSIWSPADKLTDADTVHWTGKPHRLTSLVRIDGKGFRLMGKEPATVPPLPQVSLEVLPTRTIYTFEGEGIQLTLTFMSPALPDDLDLLSRPVTYLTWEAQAKDGKAHQVAVFLEVSPELGINDRSEKMVASRPNVNGLAVLAAGSSRQPVLQKKGDDLRIDWGTLYLATPGEYLLREDFEKRQVVWMQGEGGCSQAWAEHETIGTHYAPGEFSFEKGDGRMFGYHRALGLVSDKPAGCWLMLAYDDVFSIKYFRKNLRPYWRRNGDDAAALLKKAAADYASLKKRCETFDAKLMEALRKLGGEKYAQLCTLAYRQTFAGNKIVADAKGRPLMFPKENFSNGCIGTVDVLFPQAPFFLVFSPALTKAMLVPILDYAASPRWPYGYAPHDLGTYPHATGQVYGMGGKDGDRMPLEESGNMLIMMAGLAKVEGNANLAKQYWPILTKWADYLVKEGLDPQNQLCSADMFGHMPRASNLALKAIIGIGGYAQLCEMLGEPEPARKYQAIARDYAAKWQELSKGEGRTLLAYGQPDTWAMKHNLIWDRVLGTKLIPDSMADAEIAWYLKVQKKYGLPVDNRTDTSLIDWALWSISLARKDADFSALLEPIWNYANETPSRVPLSDWFVTTDAKQKGFQARPVVGGVFIRMLVDPATWKGWATKAQKVQGAWAPIPIPATTREIVPSAGAAAVTWRYSLEEPPANWADPNFDDSTWKTAPAGFGTQGTPGGIIRTEWNTKQIWLRREFTLPERPLENPVLWMAYDEDPEVYLNGKLAARISGWSTAYEEVDIDSNARATLKPGRNVLAVRARQTYGGQYIDVGIVELLGLLDLK